MTGNPFDDEWTRQDVAENEPDSLEPVDLGPYLRGEIKRAVPTIGLARSDGLRLMYPAKEHTVIGAMESGKSWFAVGSVAAELLAGNHVVYVHFEDADPGDTLDRLTSLGVAAATILHLLHFYRPARKVNAAKLREWLECRPSLVVLDGVNEAMTLHGWKIREEDGAAEYRRHLVNPCTRAGAAVLSCDHVVKDEERRGLGPLGSIHKGNGLTGSLILLENAEPFGRGTRGRSHVFVTKDRPGHLRQHGRPTRTPGKTLMGELVIDDEQTSTPDLELHFYATTIENAPPATATDGPDLGVIAEQVYAVIVAQPRSEIGSSRLLFAAMRAAGHKLREANVKAAVDDLIVAGRIKESQHGRARGYAARDHARDSS